MFDSEHIKKMIRNSRFRIAYFDPCPRLSMGFQYGISGQIFGLISFFFFSDRRFLVVLDGKSSQEYTVNAGVPQGSILGPALVLLQIDFLYDLIFLCFLFL